MKMKTILYFMVVISTLHLMHPVTVNAQAPAKDLQGAWRSGSGENETTLICSEKFFSVAIYDVKNKKYTGSYGGSYSLEGDGYIAKIEFHSLEPDAVGSEWRGKIKLQHGVLTLVDEEGNTDWKRLDDGTPGQLAGAWLITGRYRNGQLSERAPGPRRTMKILSGTRFQWIAYNVDTKEFSGTGGGTYTTKNGKYTESIEFFSRDNTRVGASLAFDFSLEDGAWRHKGMSSKGEPIDEVWTKRENIGR